MVTAVDEKRSDLQPPRYDKEVTMATKNTGNRPSSRKTNVTGTGKGVKKGNKVTSGGRASGGSK